MSEECPCRTCSDRKIGCHQTCSHYGTWKEAMEAIGKRRKESFKIDESLRRIHGWKKKS